MPKRTRSKTQEESDDSRHKRQRSQARDRQRRYRAGLTEEQLLEKRARDRLYKERSRARKLGLEEYTPSSSKPTGPRDVALHEEGDSSDDETDYKHSVTDDPLVTYENETSDGASQEEEGYGSEGYLDHLDPSGFDFDAEDATPDERCHQSHNVVDGSEGVEGIDGSDDGYESVDERDVFGEWFDDEKEDPPYGLPTHEHPNEPARDEEDVQGASALPQGHIPPGSSSTRPPPLAPAPPGASDRYKDLVTGVLGVQVSANADTVSWTSGQRTVLPYLENASGGRTSNALQVDRDYVADLARAPEALPSSDLVVFLSRDMEEQGLLQAAQEALSRNKTVVIRGYVDTKGFQLTEEELWKRFSIFVDRPVEPQDMRKRAKTFDKPHVKTTLRDFISDVNNPHVMQMLLDFSFPQSTIPPPFERLDDGMSIGWAQTHDAASYEFKQLPADIWSGRTWGIAHHAGILSYPHHDADGAATYCIPMAGVKCWAVITLNVTRDRMKNALDSLVCSAALLSQHSNKADYETIHLDPGDLLVMPPGQPHTVYTPISGMCRGGHFFNLDTMHLTELSRFLDATRGKSFTNQVHHGTLETLCRLVLALPFINSPRKLYKNCVIALCGMVMHHTKYTSQEQLDQTSSTLESARAIADKVLQYFGITGLKRYQAHLKTTAANPYERGEQINVFDLLEGFRR